MADEYKLHIRTTGDPSGAQVTQDALEETAQAGEKIVDAVTKGDRATANFVAKLKGLSPGATTARLAIRCSCAYNAAAGDGLTKVQSAAADLKSELPPLFDPVATQLRADLPSAIKDGLSVVGNAVTAAVGDLSKNFQLQAQTLQREIAGLKVDVGALQRRPQS